MEVGDFSAFCHVSIEISFRAHYWLLDLPRLTSTPAGRQVKELTQAAMMQRQDPKGPLG